MYKYDSESNQFINLKDRPPSFDIHKSLGEALGVSRHVAKILFYKRIYDAGPWNIGSSVLGVDGSTLKKPNRELTPYELSIVSLGEEAVKIIDVHLLEQFKMQTREFEKALDALKIRC